MTQNIKKRIEQLRRGEVPEGYHKTKAGIVPIEWENYKFSELFISKNETTKDIRRYPLYSLTIEDGIIEKSVRYERSHLVKKEDAYKIMHPNDFAYNPMNIRFGAVARHKGNKVASISGYYDVFTTVHYSDLDFMERYLVSTPMMRYYCWAATGSLIEKQRVHFSQFLNFTLPLPNRKERRNIADILTQCDKIIELKKRLIKEESNQKRWLLQNLLDPNSGVRLTGFAGEWKSKSMGELFEFGSSISASREQLGEAGICYLHYGDIHNNTSGVIDVQQDFASIPKLLTDNISPKVLLGHGDVVFVDASEDYEGASKHVVVKNMNAIPFIAGLHTIPAKSIGEELVLEFKKYCFQSHFIKKQIAFYISGMKVFGLSKVNIAKIIVQYPNSDEQIAIANTLSSIDHKIELLNQELEQWQLKKKSLMQLLLTGIVRVKV